MKATTKHGFTLVELMVVISIVSLLSSVALVATNGVRVKADDAQRNQIVGEYVKAPALAYDKLYLVFTETMRTSILSFRSTERF